MRPWRLYLSASVANASLNERLRRHLPADRFTLVLPQEFTPAVPHQDLPRAIYERCLDEMRACDAALLLLDAYGVDCAFEVGFLQAIDRPVIGIAQASTRFLQNWMVKGALAAVVSLDEVMHRALADDGVLGPGRTREAAGWQGLADALAQVLPSVG